MPRGGKTFISKRTGCRQAARNKERRGGGSGEEGERERRERLQTRRREMLHLPPIKVEEDVFLLTPRSGRRAAAEGPSVSVFPRAGADGGPQWLIKAAQHSNINRVPRRASGRESGGKNRI